MRVNEKLMRITEDTIVVGIDIAKYDHYVRFVDYRGNLIYKTVKIKRRHRNLLTKLLIQV